MALSVIVDNTHLFPDLRLSGNNSRSGEPFFNGSSVILSSSSNASPSGFEYTMAGGHMFKLCGTLSPDYLLKYEVLGGEKPFRGGLEANSVDSIGIISPDSPLPYPKSNEFVAWVSSQYGDTGEEQVLKVSSPRGSFELDYLVYLPSSSISVAGATLLLDDQQEGLTYAGTWNHTANVEFVTGSAMNRTLSQTRTKGSSLKATFVGTSFALYGAVQQVPGNVTLSYVIGSFRGAVTVNHEGVTYRGAPTNRTHWTLNRPLIRQPMLIGSEDTEHTLEVTVEDATGDQALSIDYLLFTGTRWTNVSSPGSALATPFPIPGGISRNKKLAIGLGVSLPLLAALLIIAGVFMYKRSKKGGNKH